MDVDDELGLAELGVTAKNANVVEALIIQEALEETGHDSGGADAADGPAVAAAAASAAPEAAPQQLQLRRERQRLASQMVTVAAEIGAMSAALAAAEEAAAEAATAEAAEPQAPGAALAGGASLQMAVMRDRLAGLRKEQQRLATEVAELGAGGSGSAGSAGGGAAASDAGGSGGGAAGGAGAEAAAAARSRPRFGAAAMARHGGGKAAGAGGRKAGAGAAVPETAEAAQQQHQRKRARTEAGAAAAGRVATRLTADEDDLFGDGSGDASGDGGGGGGGAGGGAAGSGRLELVETEKDRLIRMGLLTPFDRLAGFERKKVSKEPDAATAATAAAAAPGGRAAAAAAPSAGAQVPFQRTGQGALRHLGRAALSEAEAAAVTRSGRRVGDYLAEAGQRALEARQGRHRAQFLEPDQLPQQERDVRKVPTHFWHQAASARKAGASTKLRRKSTLPRAKPGRPGRMVARKAPAGVAAAAAAARAGAAAGDAEEEEEQDVSEEDSKGDARDEEEEEEELDAGEEEDGGRKQRRRLRARRSGGSGSGGSGTDASAGGGPGGGQVDAGGPDDDSDYTQGSDAPDSDEDVVVVSSDGEEQDEEEEEGDSAGLSGLEDEDEDAAGAGGSGQRRSGRKKGRTRKGGKAAAAAGAGGSSGWGVDEDLYDDVDEQFYIERMRRAAAAEAEARRTEAHAKRKPRRGKQLQQQQQRRRRRRSASAGGDADGANAEGGTADAGVATAGSNRAEVAQYHGAYGSADPDAGGEASAVPGQRRGASPAAAAAPDQALAAELEELEAPVEQEPEEEEEEPEADIVFEGGFRVPARLYGRLFDYQRTAVKWLWELHVQGAGGILGDEMGLGKTVQIIAYLAGLHASGLFRPSLIVCPATVLRQWLRELRTWAPALRVVLLHESGRNPPGGSLRPDRAGVLEAALSPCPPELGPLMPGNRNAHSPAHASGGPSGSGGPATAGAAASASASSYPGVVLTTYDQLRLNRDLLLRVRWGVAVLDEGHKIRNPDSEITLVCKQLHTVHRLIMSGSPIQNRLAELWSLFDFIFPGKLGTLPVFQAQFAVPIQVGGYANASSLQVTTAYKCAVVLRDLIAPYLLRRRKADVAAQLPAKTEQVLFCTLVSEQLELYRSYLASKEVGEILEGSRRALCGIDILRKICNHPDLLERLSGQDADDYGNPARSGKLRVAERVLDSWRAAGHKALLFCQTQQMLDIFEKLARKKTSPPWRYHRMDGCTPVATRARLIDDFNTNPEVFLFLLTTKVGGLGVNLTGATRVMLYDPDWNPSTDIQARERAWRIGQSQPVTIYRLITAGTIEEKVYHRQIYKNFLTNKVLRDPRQKRFFTARDISELFTLGPEYKKGAAAAAAGGGGDTETARIFGSALDAQDLAAAVRQQAEAGAGSGTGSGSGSGGAGWLSSTAAAAAALRRRGERPGGEEAAGEEAGGGGQEREAVDGGGGEVDGEERLGKKRRKGAAGKKGASGKKGGASEAAAGNGAVAAAATAEQPAGAAGGGEQDESRVLRDLFDGGAGLRGLVDHSRIEGANDPELITLHAEAQRVAARAAEALRRSRAACAAAPISTPTWTGRHGHAGAPPGASNEAAAAPPQQQQTAGPPQRRFGNVTNNRMRAGAGAGAAGAGAGSGGAGGVGGSGEGPGGAQPFSGAVAGVQGLAAGRRIGGGGGIGIGGDGAGGAPSSAALLSQMRSRQQVLQGAAAEASRGSRGSAGGGGAAAAGAAAAVPREPAEALAAEVVSFLDARGGVVGSEELVEAFRQSVPPAQMPLFKQVLRQVAGLRRRAAGGEWVLKKEFRTAAPEVEAGAGAAGGLEGQQTGAGGSGGGAGAGAGGGGSDAYDFIDLT